MRMCTGLDIPLTGRFTLCLKEKTIMIMTIGELGKAAGIAPKTVRFYEDKGLIPRPGRTPAGYRVYGAEDVQRLVLIRRARVLGFSLSEVHRLVRLAEHGSCGSFQGQLAREVD